MFIEQQMSLIKDFPSFIQFEDSNDKRQYKSSQISNPSKRHRILLDGGLLKLELKDKYSPCDLTWK